MRGRSFAGTAILLVVACGLACSILRTKKPLTWHLTLAIDSSAPDRESAVKQTNSVIERRLEALGVSNWEIKVEDSQSGDRFLINLPDVADHERLRQVITAGGKLELVHVITPPSPSPVQTYATKEQAIASLGNTRIIPPNRRVLPYVERAGLSTAPTKWVVIESPAIINGGDLRTATAMAGRGNGDDDYEISFSLRAEGAEKFGSWTGANIAEYIGVVLNDEVKSIAFIKSQINDQGVIEGRFTKQAAEDLALVLKSGALPAPIRIVDEGPNR